MTERPDDPQPDDRVTGSHDDRVDSRAELLPEEANAGSEDPETQAEVILQESDERTFDPEGTRQESQQTLDREDQPD